MIRYYRIVYSDGIPGMALTWEQTLALVKASARPGDSFRRLGIVPVRVEAVERA